MAEAMGTDTAAASATEAKAKIFISYSRSDMAFVDRLEPALVARGFEVLIDREQIYAFEDWWGRLKSLVEQADTIVFSLSPDWLSSKVCKQEIDYAASLNKRFAPIVCRTIDPTAAPVELSRLNFIFFNDETQFEQSLGRLIDALQTDIGWVRKHTEYGEFARRWAEGGRPANSGLLLRGHVLEEAERWIGSRPPGAPAPTEATQAFITASRRAATRRRNILSGGLAAGLVLALGLAAWAWRERSIAIDERTLAQRNFDAAKSTVNSVVTDIAQGLHDVEGMRVDTVRRILGRAEAAVNDLASRTGNDPQVRMSQAEMDTLFARTYERLGATALAKSYVDKGNAIARALLAAAPDNADYQEQVALNLHVTGEIDETSGHTGAALAAYRESLDLMHAVAAKEPDEPRIQENLDISLSLLGKVLAQQGDLAGALAAHQEEVTSLRARIAKSPDNDDLQRDLSTELNSVGDIKAQEGDLDGGYAAFGEGVGITRKLVAKQPDNTEWQRDLSVGLGNVGEIFSAQGRTADAVAAYKESLDTARTLLVKDPGNRQWLDDIATCLSRYGAALDEQGNLPGALAAFQEQVDTERKLIAQDASNTEWQNNLAIGLLQAGDIRLAQDDKTDAQAEFTEALAIDRKLAAADKDNIYWQDNVTHCLTRLGDVLKSSGDNAGALADYREAVDIDRALATQYPDKGEQQRNLGLALDRLADALAAQQDVDGELAVDNEALALRTALHNKNPTNPVWQVDLTYSQERIGGIDLDKKDFAGALQNFQAANENMVAMAGTDPQNTEWQYNLALTFAKLSDVYNASGRNDKSMAAEQQGLAIMEKLNKIADVALWKDVTGRLERRIAFLNNLSQKQQQQPPEQQQSPQ